MVFNKTMAILQLVIEPECEQCFAVLILIEKVLSCESHHRHEYDYSPVCDLRSSARCAHTAHLIIEIYHRKCTHKVLWFTALNNRIVLICFVWFWPCKLWLLHRWPFNSSRSMDGFEFWCLPHKLPPPLPPFKLSTHALPLFWSMHCHSLRNLW